MQKIPQEQILNRIRTENPWWQGEPIPYINLQARAYLELFYPLVVQSDVRRAVVLMGPRRVGKTVMLHHSINKLIEEGVNPSSIGYISVDHPIYNGLRLDEMLEHYLEARGEVTTDSPTYLIFDEVQYLKDWEVHLKVLVDDHPKIKFIVSGSAAAALKFKSKESGAGRFTDFLLPPLTFHEYLLLLNETDLAESLYVTNDVNLMTQGIALLNEKFIDYLNFGGYPEVMFSETIRSDPGRYVKSDIVDKVLLRDLPSLYGISDVQELNHLFTSLAYNSAQEVSLSELAQNAGVAKNTLGRYIEYLEAAFLVRKVHRVDRNSKRFKRINFFKIYLTNPSIRAALFSPIGAKDEAMGGLVETAIYSQWFHTDVSNLHYARWDSGEVDIIRLAGLKPKWAVEVKWSDWYYHRPHKLKSLIGYCKKNGLTEATVTTFSEFGDITRDNIAIRFIPSSLYCYALGRAIVKSKRNTHESDVPNKNAE